MGMNTLAQIITEKGLTRAEVARMTGYERASVTKHCQKGKLTAEAALRYAHALGVAPSVFRPDLWQSESFNAVERIS